MHSTVVKLKKWKEENKVSSVKIAKELGVAKITVYSWFQGKNTPTSKKLIDIEMFLKSKEVNEEPAKAVTRKEYNKKYELVELETVEEVIDALVDGEVVMSKDPNVCFKRLNGVLVAIDRRLGEEKIVSINPTIVFSDGKVNCHVKRKIPLVLEVGKRYVDENGKIWIVYREDSDLDNNRWFVAILEQDGETSVFEKNGKSMRFEHCNLVEEA